MAAQTISKRRRERQMRMLAAMQRCLVWVKTGKAQCEHMFSALPLRADIAQQSRHVRFVPISEVIRLFNHFVGAR
jgi:hypothetical protein